MKKGHLILEVVMYIALVGILFIPIMNIGLFLFENYNKEKVDLQNKINFIELNNSIKQYVEEPGTKVSVKTSNIIKQTYLSISEAKSNKEKYAIDMDKTTGLVLKIYNELKNDPKIITINHDIKEFKITENKNVIYIDYIFKNGYEDTGVYEK